MFSFTMVLKSHILSADMTLGKITTQKNYQNYSFSVASCAVGMWLSNDLRTLTLVQHKSF